MARLKIENLGPIKKIELPVEQFNLIIGEQATGKSTVCKAIYFFREIKNLLIDYLYGVAIDGGCEDKFPKALNRGVKDVFIQLFGYSQNMPLDLSVKYEYKEEISAEIWLRGPSDGKKYFALDYSTQLRRGIRRIEIMAEEYRSLLKAYDGMSSFAINEKSRIYQEITRQVSELLDDDMTTYYIPAGRELLTLLTNQKTRFDYDTIDLVNRRFMQFIESIQPKFDGGVSEAYQYYPIGTRKFDVHRMADQIIRDMKGEYIYQKGREYLIEHQSGERILINFASSGQQELLWLMNQLYILMLRNEKAFVIIEEPEAHVYPALQRDIMEFIVQFMNFTGSTVVITTHSPYMLMSANNLYYGGRVMERAPGLKDQIEKILGKGKSISPGRMNGCKLIKTRGETAIVPLLDEEMGELSTELIDEISETINRHYTELVYLEDEYENTREG